MSLRAPNVLPLACVVLWLLPLEARAGLEPNTYVFRSSAQEAGSTLVLVGSIRAFHPLDPGAAPQAEGIPREMRAFVAEVEVARVEKGTGIQAGDVVYVRFHAPRTLDEVEHPFPGFSCGQVDLQVAPGEGDPARIYLVRDRSYQLVADYPLSFFRIPKKEWEPTRSVIRNLREPLTLVVAILGGCAIGFAAGRCLRKPRKGEPLDSVVRPDPFAGLHSLSTSEPR